MARQAAGFQLVPSRSGTARRAVGGTLMATGAAAAAFFALLTAWYVAAVVGDILRSGLDDPGEARAVLKVIATGGLAVGACALLAGLGRLILGPRPPA